MADRLSIIAFTVLGFIVRLLPLKLVQRVGKLKGLFFFISFPSERKLLCINLDLCFPEKDLSWKNKIIKESYINLCIDLFEFLYFPEFKKETIKSFITIDNGLLLEKAIAKDRGIVFVSGHISNWELMAFCFPYFSDEKLNIITKIQASKGLNKKINQYRELSGNIMIEIGFSLKKIFEKLRQKESIAFLIDQSAHPDYSIYVDFFGHKVPAFSGPAKIFLKQRPEILLGYFVRNQDYSYTLKFQNIRHDDLTEYSDENVKELTQRMQTGIENVIRENPGQWLWFHKRFKHMKN